MICIITWLVQVRACKAAHLQWRCLTNVAGNSWIGWLSTHPPLNFSWVEWNHIIWCCKQMIVLSDGYYWCISFYFSYWLSGCIALWSYCNLPATGTALCVVELFCTLHLNEFLWWAKNLMEERSVRRSKEKANCHWLFFVFMLCLLLWWIFLSLTTGWFGPSVVFLFPEGVCALLLGGR